jgi:hypothetical protein
MTRNWVNRVGSFAPSWTHQVLAEVEIRLHTLDAATADPETLPYGTFGWVSLR